MKKKIAIIVASVCLFLCTVPLSGSNAESWPDVQAAPETIEQVTDVTVYDAADQAGEIINTDRPDDPSRQDMTVYSFTPLDAVLIIDISGSMDRADEHTGKTLLDYAKIASTSFATSLLSINPASRIGVVAFSDSAVKVTDLLGLNDEAQLEQALNSLWTDGRTNTGDGFSTAANMLNSQAMEGRRRMVIMLTDGQANEGAGDPVQYTILQGTACAGMGYVYNIGMVGGLGESERNETRRALNANYETRYFELDFDQIADAGSMITMLTSSIAYAASSAESISDAGDVSIQDFYQLSVGPGFNVRIKSPSGECLSDFPEDTSYSASFGTLTRVDDNKHISFFAGQYEIDIRGNGSYKSSYSLQMIHGSNMEQTALLSYTGWSHESIGRHVSFADATTSVTDTGYNCIDPLAVDWYGQPVTGLENAAAASARSNVQVLSAPDQNAAKIGKLIAADRFWVLAESGDARYFFISYTDENGAVSRGWIPADVLSGIPDGFVPTMHMLSIEAATATGTDVLSAPDAGASVSFRLKENKAITILHCERDAGGNIWVYVTDPNVNPVQYGYIPASAIADFNVNVPDNFQIGHNVNQSLDALVFSPISIGRDQGLKVYSYPSESSWRGAKGKALMSTNGEVRAVGWVNNSWLLVQYDKNDGSCRVGYVAGKDINSYIQALPLISLRPVTAVIVNDCVLTDDPFGESEKIANLKSGTNVIYLTSYDNVYTFSNLAYIETTVGNKKVRGFVPACCVEQR